MKLNSNTRGCIFKKIININIVKKTGLRKGDINTSVLVMYNIKVIKNNIVDINIIKLKYL